eukprot:TRINITY_DN4592_c0_g1_i1.p1 TRINITY_DN4592_c0_g1~~TRINITY_DN4592_c0_g1_i1.p1  ORF type:complete len:253 (+),score=62.09 TRINITY_DN4592_c0_g1_i1:246-1004(+)
MCQKISNAFFKVPEITNRLWETDKFSKKNLMMLRVAGFAVLLEINIMCTVLYATVNYLKIFALTNITLTFSLLTYGFILLDLFVELPWVWKTAHVLFEIFFSFCVALTIVFIIVVICYFLSVHDEKLAGLDDGWIELAIKIQMHTAVLALYLADFYTNRIECCLRHTVLTAFSMGVIVGIYIGASKVDGSIDDFFDWRNSESIAFLVTAAVLVVAVFCFTTMLSDQKKKRYVTKLRSQNDEKGAVHISIDRI